MDKHWQVEQWGSVSTGQSTTTDFPIAFNSTVYSVVITSIYDGNIEIYDTIIKSYTTTKLALYVGGANHGSKPTKRYIAIGK